MSEISPDHLALGLLVDPDALAVRAITAQGVALETMRRTVSARLPAGSGEVPDLIPFDARARKALEPTFREALRLGHNYVGTEHILLALLELEEAAGVLTGLGLDKNATERYVDAVLATIVGAQEDTES